jgi:probable phosphoglycerate mutase
LDEVGRDQAARAAAYLAASDLSAEGSVVVSSDLTRAAETAATLTALLGVPLKLDERLRELFLGSWEGLTRAEVAVQHPAQYADWMAGRPIRGRASEEPEEVAQRALAALADLPPAAVAVVVTHGGTGIRLIEALLGLGADHPRLFGPLGNCAWSELSQQSGRWRLLRHNQSLPDLPDRAPERPPGEPGPVLRAVPDDGRPADRAAGLTSAAAGPDRSGSDADAVL